MNIEDLISQYIDGDLPSEVEAEMHHRLAVSPEARKLFRAQIALRGIARNPKVLHAPAPELRARLFERLEREEGMKPSVPLSPPPPAYAAEMASPVPSSTVRGETRRRRRAIAWLLPTVVASIITVAIIWKPGTPLVRPDTTTIADGSVDQNGSIDQNGSVPETGRTPAPLQQLTTGSAADVSAQSAPAAQAAPKEVAPVPAASLSAGRGATPPMTARAESHRRSLGEDRMAYAPERRIAPREIEGDMAEGEMATIQADSSHTLAVMSDGGGSSHSSFGTDASSPVHPLALGKSMSSTTKTSPTEFGKKFAEPDVHTMEGNGGTKPERRDDGGSGNGPMAEKPDGANGSPRTMAAMPPSAAPTESLTSAVPRSADTRSADTVGGRPEMAYAFSESRADADMESFEEATPRFVITLQQASFVSSASGDVNLDMGMRGGMQFDRGRQLVFAVIGLSGYRSSLSDSVTQLLSNGTVSHPAAAPRMLAEQSYEIAGGVGYRYTVRLSKSWGAGAGAWSTISGHYLRAGLEAPVTFLPVRWLRLEVVPSVRYSRVHGGSAITGERRLLSSGDEETIQRITTPNGDGAVDVGIGFGVSMMW
jgi:hypothetical protein